MRRLPCSCRLTLSPTRYSRQPVSKLQTSTAFATGADGHARRDGGLRRHHRSAFDSLAMVHPTSAVVHGRARGGCGGRLVGHPAHESMEAGRLSWARGTLGGRTAGTLGANQT